MIEPENAQLLNRQTVERQTVERQTLVQLGRAVRARLERQATLVDLGLKDLATELARLN